MRFRLAAVGKVSKQMDAACADYAGRIKRYIKFDVVETPDGGRSKSNPAEARKREGVALLKAMPAGATLVAVTRNGRASNSSELAARVEQWQLAARDVVFAIGGANGFSDELLATASDQISLSQLTLPHDIARLVLLEQIYRACTILRGEPYHRGP